jgi:hypothetical protein
MVGIIIDRAERMVQRVNVPAKLVKSVRPVTRVPKETQLAVVPAPPILTKPDTRRITVTDGPSGLKALRTYFGIGTLFLLRS